MTVRRKITLAISTCPNDTFAFHALMNRLVDWRDIEFDVQLMDIQQLNDGLFADQFDVAKASFHAAALLTESTVVLRCGAAIGFGVGPLLLASAANRTPGSVQSSVTLCPGQHTTAAMLMQIFYADAIHAGRTKIEHRLFSDIMPALESGTADFGVCIHEGRFVWETRGLALVEDLGTRWEQETDHPLPLGGILASRRMNESTIRTVQSVIRDSIEFAKITPTAALPTMRQYADEMDDAVLMQHVDLYVNDWTVDLGLIGTEALAELFVRAQEAGLVANSASPLEIMAI